MEMVVDAQGLVNGVDPAEDPLRFSAKRITLGEWLVVWGHATTAQVDLAEREARRKRMTLAESLRDLQFVDPRVVSSYIAQRSGTEVADIRKQIVSPEILDLIPRELALRHLALLSR